MYDLFLWVYFSIQMPWFPCAYSCSYCQYACSPLLYCFECILYFQSVDLARLRSDNLQLQTDIQVMTREIDLFNNGQSIFYLFFVFSPSHSQCATNFKMFRLPTGLHVPHQILGSPEFSNTINGMLIFNKNNITLAESLI